MGSVKFHQKKLTKTCEFTWEVLKFAKIGAMRDGKGLIYKKIGNDKWEV